MSPRPAFAMRVIALGQFSDSLPPLPPRLARLAVTPYRAGTLKELPADLGPGDLLLTELVWLVSLAQAERIALSQRAPRLGGWIALTDASARFTELIQWQRLGVQHFFRQPLDPERLAEAVEALHDRLAGQPLRAILLEDEKSALDYYANYLRAAGIEVLASSDPLLVLDHLDEFQPDVLVLDIEMPACRGPELVTIVRQHPSYARLPVLFLTAMESLEDKLEARSAAAEDFLPKSSPPELLLAAVTSHARRHRSLQRIEANNLRHQAKARLRLEQLRLAIDAHAIVSIADAQGRITYVNDKFCAISGYAREELIGQNHRLIKSGLHEASFYQEMWRTIGAGRVWHGEVCNRRKDGSLYWVAATIYPITDGQGRVLEYISIRTDITSLKAAQEALQISEERLRRGQNYANIGTWEWNIETGDLYWSERIAPLFGYAPGELATSYENFLKAVHPDDRQAVIDAVNASVEHDAPYEIEHRVVWPDGTVRWLLERGAVTRDASGKPLKMLGVVQDIDARKRAELALIEAREAAERANRAKSDFLSSMSHELRTPLNAIIGFAQMLEYDDALSDDQLDNVHEILKAGRHLLELINEVLDLAKIEAGRIDLSMEEIPLGDLLEECRQLVLPMAQTRSIALEFAPCPEVVVYADRVRLKQVLLNLLSNAIKYNRPNGKVSFSVTPGQAGHWRLFVTDTGQGIAPEHLGELFQPFSRLGAETSGIEGTGIGLTITRRLVEMMGGEIGVESAPGVGSTFWVELAAGEAPKVGAGETAHASPLATAALGERKTVLAIDDNPSNLKLIAQVIGKRPHLHLLTAHSGELGVELALAHRPDLVLLDIHMPGLDGYQVLEVFKKQALLRTIPVVAVTANAMPRDIERGLAAGFAAYLTKPIDVAQMLATLDKFLAGKETPQDG